MTAVVMALAMSMVISVATLNGCGSTPKEIVSKTAKEQQTDAQTADATGESGRDEEGSVEMASGNYGDKTIGFVGTTLDNKYHTTLANGAKVEAEAERVKTEAQTGDQRVSADAQLGIIENMIANRADGILPAPNSSDGLGSALTECKEAGIPITNLDTKPTDEGLANIGLDIPFCGTNDYKGTKLTGEYVAKNLGRGTRTAILKGVEGQTNITDRYNGFVEGARDAVTIVAEQTANWEADQGYTAVQNIISTDPDAELFFRHNNNMGIGALRAIKGANMQEQIQIIELDAVSEALNLVENEEFLATVTQYPAKMGKLGVDNMLKIFDGDKAESYIDTGTEVITKDSVGESKNYLKTFEWERG